MLDIIYQISEELSLKNKQVEAAISLLDEGNTVPYIARYKKDVTGNLTDKNLRDIEDRLSYLRNLNDRKESVIKLIDEKNKLTPELKEEILNAKTLAEVEDLYRPYKEKRKTRGVIAKEKGLDQITNLIYLNKKIDDFDKFLSSFIDETKKLNTIDDVKSGVIDILSEDIGDEAKYRKYIKNYIFNHGLIESKEKKKDEKDTYGTYASFSIEIKRIKPYQYLAIARGEKEECLKMYFSYDKDVIKERITKDFLDSNYLDIFKEAINDSLKRIILPSVENEINSEVKEKCEDKSIEVFKKNLEALLLYPPLKNKKILGFDPGFKSGCKYAYVDELSIPHDIGVVYITSGSKEKIEDGKKEIAALIKKYNIDYIALGNGTASRESETILNDMIKEYDLRNCKIFIVNESGASVYSASKLAEKEFPELTVEKRSAISLARRIIDPLAELVKIEPKAIGVGQYQHDMNQTKLNEALKKVVEDCVNKVGVKLNTASVSLLSYVSGITSSIATNIYEYRKSNGNFKNRNELLKVKGLKDKTFKQCAGFLRIEDSDEILDNTSIHPDNYLEAKEILKETKIDVLKDSLDEKELKLAKFNENNFLKNHPDIGKETLKDIIDEIKNPGRDIRESLEIVELNNEAKTIEDLKVGMILNGTIRNIMDFGMFVDINVHQDGLVHISEISDSFIKDISSLYSVNQLVKVKVISVDVAKKRIGLSIKQAK